MMIDKTPNNKTIPLDQLQKWMQQVLIDPLGTATQQPKDFLSDEWSDHTVETFIKPSSRMNGRQRLAIYQQSYLARLRNCMAAQFKALAFALGEDLFQQFADLYLQTHPSTSYTLTHLGEKFAAFLEDSRPDKEQAEKESWIDFMIELIEFEYHITTIFDATAELPPALATADTSDESIQLVPLFYLFEQEYPVCSYYRAFINDLQPELPFAEESYACISRYRYQLSLQSLSAAQFHFLHTLKTTGDVLATKQIMMEKHGFTQEAMEQAWQSWKTQWIKSEIFTIKTNE